MEHDRARAEVDTLYEQTLAVVGDGWNPASSAEWRGCTRLSLADEQESWARFTQRFGELDQTPHAIAVQIAQLWNRLGYPADIVSDDRMTPPRKVVSYPAYLTGTTEEGFGVVFTIGDGYADFTGYSRCVPVDADRDDLSS
ncbi:hypothetical protein [Leifsonia sp. LS1]|uniref:hypothetical protein n=1 Tax=Leifsonia sp. LS1 TaxID=2828483 RepID=UPI001CFD2403|nr:hypothetical protein [Leifsonia sp. LS1]